MRRMHLLTVGVFAAILAAGCGRSSPPSEASEQPIVPPPPPPSADTCTECLTITAEGRLLASEGKKESSVSLKELRTKLETKAAILREWREQTGKPLPEPEATPGAKPASLVVRVKADKDGAIAAMTLEKDGRATKLGKSSDGTVGFYAEGVVSNSPGAAGNRPRHPGCRRRCADLSRIADMRRFPGVALR